MQTDCIRKSCERHKMYDQTRHWIHFSFIQLRQMSAKIEHAIINRRPNWNKKEAVDRF